MDIAKMLGMVEGKIYKKKYSNNNLYYAVEEGNFIEIMSSENPYSLVGRISKFSNLTVDSLKNIDFEEIHLPPKEYTLEELNNLDLPHLTKIKSLVSKNILECRIGEETKRRWILDTSSLGIHVDELLGKWVIVEGE